MTVLPGTGVGSATVVAGGAVLITVNGADVCPVIWIGVGVTPSGTHWDGIRSQIACLTCGERVGFDDGGGAVTGDGVTLEVGLDVG